MIVKWIPSSKQQSDGFTKLLPRQSFEIFVSQIGLEDISKSKSELKNTQSETLKLRVFHATGNAYAVALVTVAMTSEAYFDGDALTDKAILNNGLLSKCAIGNTYVISGKVCWMRRCEISN